MAEQKVKFQSIVEGQLPSFVASDFPLVGEFLKQYYISQEFQGSSVDLIQNIDSYLKLDTLTTTVNSTTLSASVDYNDTTITVGAPNYTHGFPEKYGLLKIDDEIITYTSKTTISFKGCVRGFSGITSYIGTNTPDQLVFSSSKISTHENESVVQNLSTLFLKEFLVKVKDQFSPGFSDRTLYAGLNENLFIKQSADFYSSKGTEESFKILFGALYGENVDVIKPSDYLFRPSDAGYRVTKDLVTESIDGDPLDLLNRTLYQDAYADYDITKAYGSVTDVEVIPSIGSTYYKVSLDYDFDKDINVEGSIFGDFGVHPKTKVISVVSSGSTLINVDSTVGFAKSGSLSVNYANGNSGIVSYQSKSTTQFFDVATVSADINAGTDVRLDAYAYGYSGVGTNNPVKIRIGAVLSDFVSPKETRYFSVDDTIKVQSLGISQNTVKDQNWFTNLATYFKVKSIELLDESDYSYSVTTYDINNIRIGDTLQIKDDNGNTVTGKVYDNISAYAFSIKGQGILSSARTYVVHRDLVNANSITTPTLKKYTANVQNVYDNFDDEVLIASNSIPSHNQDLTYSVKKYILDGTYTGEIFKLTTTTDHGLYTGDAIYYSPYIITPAGIDDFTGRETSAVTSKFSNVNEGVYFVERINENDIKLASSRSNLFNSEYISVSGIVTSNTLQYYDFDKKIVSPQEILRKITDPSTDSGIFDTNPGTTGILVDGVEVLNYKSQDSIFYGPVDNIEVSAPGSGYDVINPPLLTVEDSVGTAATGLVNVVGDLKRFEILDTGFDYLNIPSVVISGGNGEGAKAEADLIKIEHSSSFNAEAASARVDLTNNVIGFSTYHKFRNGEEIIYRPESQLAIAGLVTDSKYFVSLVGLSSVSLHPNFLDAIAGINTISLTAFGVGVQKLESINKKKVVSKIVVVDPGSGYESKERTVTNSGINTALNLINIVNHGYDSGEVISYSTTGNVITGLQTSLTYMVTKVDANNFRVSTVGLGTTAKDFYADNEDYIDFSSTGSGTHSFNYPPITVSVNGVVGIATTTGEDFQCKVQPIFRGSIKTIHMGNKGVGYGSSEIINYNRQPLVTLESGTKAEAIPIISDGKIIEVLMTNNGAGYNSPPDIIINGDGDYAELVPILSNGQISSIKVIKGGTGYVSDKTTLTIKPAGLEASFITHINRWTINLFEKNYPIVTPDDGVIHPALNSNYQLQYTYLYAPRRLRESVYPKTIDNKTLYGSFDLQKLGEEEIVSNDHSPIIGWAYDGSPIYGPYGLSDKAGGIIKKLVSGYKKVLGANRPPQSVYPLGFFVEDYEFNDSGDLDRHNGRFCITPDFPNGVYAYFATIDQLTDSDGPFENYFRPAFPYLIGNSFNSQQISFNFDKKSNQDDYDLKDSDWFRNTYNYNLTSADSGYDYLYDPTANRLQDADVKAIVTGGIDAIDIIGSGTGYKVNDNIIFDNELTGGVGASSKISRIVGQDIDSVTSSTSTVENVELEPHGKPGEFLAFAASPHSLLTNDKIVLSGFNTSVNNLYGSYAIGVKSDFFNLSVGVGTTGATGLTTYFDINGDLSYPSIRPNDILALGDEQVTVLNVDTLSSRIRVLRSVGASHTASTEIYSKPRKFTFKNSNINNAIFNIDKQIYFNPSDAVGLGSTAGVGIGSTIVFSNPGAGITEIFVPTKTIYLPGHGLETGDLLTYSDNGDGGLGVATAMGSDTFYLQNQDAVFAAKVNSDLIGISTIKVGVGSTGNFVSVGSTFADTLYFTGIGTGSVHSFKTVKSNVVKTLVSKNTVTVATAATHGMVRGDSVTVSVNPTTSKTLTVKYNDYNRRIVINPKSFVAGDVDIATNTITLTDHGLVTGDKIIHTATTSSGGLVNNKIYYVIYDTKNKIKLSSTLYGSKQEFPFVVDITSASAGTISPINPPVIGYRNNKLVFDLSDNSLAVVQGISTYSAFQLNFYKDEAQGEAGIRTTSQIFDSTGASTNFEVYTTGKVGIDTNASLTLSINDRVPSTLYYEFTVINKEFLTQEKKDLVVDRQVIDNNQVIINNSSYSGTHVLSGVGTTSFNYELTVVPESSSYIATEAVYSYDTSSLTAYGSGISSARVIYAGKGYKVVPGVSSITSTLGAGAVLEPTSKEIGKILKTSIRDVGVDYPSDTTLRPVANVPEILKVEPLASFKSIGISSDGKNYSIAPSLTVVDGNTKKVVGDVDLTYELGDDKVTILKNTYGIYYTNPRIVPINNTNGVGISTISYDSTTQDVTVGLNTAFSDSADFPFVVGDKVMIENISVGVDTAGKGYNSEDYAYKLFTLTSVHASIGGAVGVVTFSLKDDFLGTGEYPGFFDAVRSAGTIVPEKFFPIFKSVLQKNIFLKGETVTNGTKTGEVESWNSKIDVVKVSTKKEFEVGDTLIGETSNTRGIVKKKINFNSSFNTKATSIVPKGWKNSTGVLNDNIQRIPDNNYYQYFSYSLKSRVALETWENAVSSLNHTAGFKQFSDLVMESRDNLFTGLDTPSDPGVEVVADLSAQIDLNCYNDFDLVTENGFYAGSRYISDEINFSTRVLTDYYESVGNRVLKIDDLSPEFNSDPRPTPFSIVDKFDINIRSRKYFTYVRDKRYTAERQFMIVSLMHNDYTAYINQYARMETYPDLGSFDFSIAGSEGNLLFYPLKSKYNNYNVTLVAHDLWKQSAGIATVNFGLGSVVNVGTTTTTASEGSSSAISVVGIASTYRSAKILVSIGETNQIYNPRFEYDELNIVHDGSEIDSLEYGQITDTWGGYSISGIGTYWTYYSGDQIKVDLIPDSALEVDTQVTALAISIASTHSTGIGTTSLQTGLFDSHYTSIASSGSPTATTVAEYAHDSTDRENDYSAAYYLASVEDTTNNRYTFSEVAVIDDGTTPVVMEWASIGHNAGLGTFGVTTTSAGTQLKFTPTASIATQVRIFQNALRLVDQNNDVENINNVWSSGYGDYSGTHNAIRRSFDLKYKQKPIFQVAFNGSSPSIANTSTNIINLGQHFFVSGEEVSYSHSGTTSDEAIGIASASFAGIGTTDKVPSSVFIVKVDENHVKLATSAENALKLVPDTLDLTSVGIGTSHSFLSQKKNEKALIAVDNYFQSPVVGSALTTALDEDLSTTQNTVALTGVSSFFSQDLIQVDDEIMIIRTVGFGTANVCLIDRNWMGTTVADHASGSLVRKVNGNYNIVDNKIHFVEAPQGPTPLSSTTNAPDDRDWVGITTYSKFQGRTFMRSGEINGTEETYTKNILFDDISSQFTGIAKTFTLKSERTNITGISTNDGIVLINGIFQGPQGTQGVTNDYDMSENSGITSITFSGSISSVRYDVNSSSIPVGGVIVSVGSKNGFAYQPLVAAGGTATVSAAGTISSISIGQTGSGYRAGIQTVGVGIQTSSLSVANIVSIGTATISNGHITGIAITNPQRFYVPRSLSNVLYDSATGLTTVTTNKVHGLKLGDEVELSGIAFTCAYSPAVAISTAVYDNLAGIITVTTSSAHGLAASGQKDHVIFTGLGMTCGLGTETHYYPRGEDPLYNTAVSIADTSSTTITVNAGVSNVGDQFTHTFVRATSGAVVSGGSYAHTFTSGKANSILANNGSRFTPSGATYAPSTGLLTITSTAHGLTTSNTVQFDNDALTFTCAMDSDVSEHSYPRSTDPVAGIGTTITAVSANTFTVNVGTSTEVTYDVSTATYNPSTGSMVLTIGSHNLTKGISIKLADESITFKCAKDSNATEHRYPRKADPYFGGSKVNSVLSTTQFTAYVGTSTVPTTYNGGGTVQAAIIAPRDYNNSSSGIDPAAEGSVITKIIDTSNFEVNTGISTRDHLYARSGTVKQPTIVVVDAPDSYENIPLTYSSSSSGIGAQATADIVVGQGSSVIEFSIRNTGYGYGQNEILTVPIGGLTGIPTNTSLTFDEFQITLDKTETDKFAGWTVGRFEVLDSFDEFFDGDTRSFQLQLNNEPVTIRAANGSPIDVDAVLLIFINDILQVPGDAYTFDGGTMVNFTEPPKGQVPGFANSGDKSKVIFYKGTGGVDVAFKDILETVKKGDTLQIKGSNPEDKRAVTRVNSTDKVETNAYSGPGIDNNPLSLRPVVWCKQTEDKVVNGQIINKTRVLYESLVNPTTFGIQSVGIGSTDVWVQSIKPFFDPKNENTSDVKRKTIELVTQDSKVGASATAIVSAGGTISSLDITSAGAGYTVAPVVTIATPVGIGTTERATATASLTSGTVGSLTVSYGGTTTGVAYTRTNPPEVLIAPPLTHRETNQTLSYEGDFGVVTGITTVSVGVASTGIKFDLFIPVDSYLRDSDIMTGSAKTVSGIGTNYYLTVYNTNVGNGVTSLNRDGTDLGIGTQFLDNVYQVAAVSIASTSVPGIALTAVAQVTVNVADYNSLSGIGQSQFFGQFSWGRIIMNTRTVPITLNAYTNNGTTGLSTSFVVSRDAPLKYVDYTS